MKSFHPFPLVSIALVLFSFGTPTQAEVRSPYPVMDSGVWADWMGASKVHWLDNRRVIFVGTQTREKTINREKLQIQIWDTKINMVTPYTEPVKSVHICYREGYIDYSFEDEKKKKRRYAGNFGQEKLFVPPNAKNAARRWMDCQFHASQIPLEKLEGPKRHNLTLLLYRHGYLDRGSVFDNSSNKPTLYYRRGVDKPIQLPDLSRRYIDYYDFKNAYLVKPIGQVNAVWWLYPDGKMESVRILDTPYRVGGNSVYYTRKGFFIYFYDGRPPSFRVPGNTGGYLITENDEQVKLIAGYLDGVTVSPDGCKIAFAHYPYLDATRIDDPGRVTLKAVNLCAGEENKP